MNEDVNRYNVDIILVLIRESDICGQKWVLFVIDMKCLSMSSKDPSVSETFRLRRVSGYLGRPIYDGNYV